MSQLQPAYRVMNMWDRRCSIQQSGHWMAKNYNCQKLSQAIAFGLMHIAAVMSVAAMFVL